MTSPAPLLRLATLATALALVVAGCTPVGDPAVEPSALALGGVGGVYALHRVTLQRFHKSVKRQEGVLR